MSAKKVAWGLGVVFLIGLVIIALSGSLVDTLDGIWTWIFKDMLKIDPVPPSPFQSSLDNAPVYAMIDTNLII